ncbi:MAG: hypothetical protein MRJ52_11095 [Nitrosomonas sp.]|nr:hypothetical protein [Nitrosomonas sp.]
MKRSKPVCGGSASTRALSRCQWHEWIWEDAVINTLLEATNRALGELKFCFPDCAGYRSVYRNAW